jgi:hypothetical protein
MRLELAFSKGLNRVGASLPHVRSETDSISKKLCFLVFKIPDSEQSPEAQ